MSKRYRVLMIAPTSFFADYGCHVRILEEALVLRRLGHQVTVVTYFMGRPIAGLDIVRTPPLPWRSDYEVGSSRHKLAFDAYLAPTALLTALKRQPDLIHAHLHEGALIGAPIARLLRVPLVFDLQGSLTGEMVDHHFLNPDGPLYRPVRRLERFIDRLPAAILTSSTHARQMLIEEFDVPRDRIHPLPDCVDGHTFRPAEEMASDDQSLLKQQLQIPPDRPLVVYLGLLADYQGTHFIIRSAVQLKSAGVDAHFLIMGYPNHQRYVQMATGLGVQDRVTLTGKIPYDQAARYLALGQVAVAPKLSATEGSGKVLNYMALGLPTVAFDTPVQREYLGKEGVYAPPGDQDAFTAGIKMLLDDPETGARKGRALRQRVTERFSWDAAGRQIVALYDRLIAQRKSQ